MPVLDPILPGAWIRALLLASEGATSVVGGETVPADAVAFCGTGTENVRIAPAREGFSPLEFLSEADVAAGVSEAACWPYILFGRSRDCFFDNYAQDVVLADDEFLIRAMHREDLCEGDVEDANWPGFIAIQTAFQGAMASGEGLDLGGIVHGCTIERSHIRLYGEPGKRVSEMGIIARIFST